MASNVSVESLHHKISTRLHILGDISRYLGNIITHWGPAAVHKQRWAEIDRQIERVHDSYSASTGPILAEVGAGTGSSADRVQRFQSALLMDNITGHADSLLGLSATLLSEIEGTTGWDKHHNRPEFLHGPPLGDGLSVYVPNGRLLRMSPRETMRRLLEIYDGNSVNLQPQAISVGTCDQCGAKMIDLASTSDMLCENCGNTFNMGGVVSDPSQYSCFQNKYVKHKRYEADRHCEKWIDQIQATDNIAPTPEEEERLAAVAKREFTIGGRLRNMRDMSCRHMREMLKETKLTKYNNHAPTLRKIITAKFGEPVIPPQLTPTERQEILIDFSRAMAALREVSSDPAVLALIGREAVENNIYYPYGLLKIISKKLRDDARLLGLVQCIHFQGTSTLRKDDCLWKLICEKLGDYEYEPTDRTILVHIG